MADSAVSGRDAVHRHQTLPADAGLILTGKLCRKFAADAGWFAGVWSNQLRVAEKYGESITGTEGAPWPNCTMRSNVVYVHTLDGTLKIPEIPAKFVTKKWLTAENEKPDAILKLEFDRPLEELAEAMPSAGSLTQGRTIAKNEDGFYAVDLGAEKKINRLEFTIENPGYRRGQGRKFELQARETDGTWKTIHQGQVFGAICSNTFAPVSAQWCDSRLTLLLSGNLIYSENL